MSSKKPKVLVLTGDGINCETETAQAFRLAGFDSDIHHLNDLIAERFHLDDLSKKYSALALPGGFSFGDDLTSGKILALKIQRGLGWDLLQYTQRGGLVIGVCNGFQALIRMGVFSRDISITQNEGGKFINRWERVTPRGNKCIWLRGMGSLELPIRHGEGRIVIGQTRKTEILIKMERTGMNCLKYEGNPNGSEEKIAGLCDPSGRILGLMPHPEAFVRWTAHPDWTSQSSRSSAASHAMGQGLMVFENAFREAVSGS